MALRDWIADFSELANANLANPAKDPESEPPRLATLAALAKPSDLNPCDAPASCRGCSRFEVVEGKPGCVTALAEGDWEVEWRRVPSNQKNCNGRVVI